MEIKNQKAILKNLAGKMEDIADALECVGKEVSEEESHVFSSIRDTIDYINDFVDSETNNDAMRMFEVGDFYYDDNCKYLKRVTKKTDKSIWFDGSRCELRKSSYNQALKEYALYNGLYFRA